MKNKKSGFLLSSLIVIAILVIAGGIYFYSQGSNTTGQTNISAAVIRGIQSAIKSYTSTSTTVDLAQYIPGDGSVQSWFTSFNPALPAAGVRWSNHINTTAAGDKWWRWQFSGPPNEGTHDIMFYSAYDTNLHYAETDLGCNASGDNCSDVTTFAQTITLAPRYYKTDTTQSGTGTSAVIRTYPGGVCKGKVDYTWKVVPYAGELNARTNVRSDLPIIHYISYQNFYDMTGPTDQCGNFQYTEQWWLGTACVNNVCKKAVLNTWGGNLPFANDTHHWSLGFSGFKL